MRAPDLSVTLSRTAGQYLTLFFHQHTEAKDVITSTRCNVSFFSLQNAVYFVTQTFLVPVLFTFYIKGVLKFKCEIPVPKC
jgi:hypothetical protein